MYILKDLTTEQKALAYDQIVDIIIERDYTSIIKMGTVLQCMFEKIIEEKKREYIREGIDY
jgi:hypothetical protein